MTLIETHLFTALCKAIEPFIKDEVVLHWRAVEKQASNGCMCPCDLVSYWLIESLYPKLHRLVAEFNDPSRIQVALRWPAMSWKIQEQFASYLEGVRTDPTA